MCPQLPHPGALLGGAPLAFGISTAYLSIIVLVPLALVVVKSTEGWATFWEEVTTPQAPSPAELTFVCSLSSSLVNAVMGTLIAWMLVVTTSGQERSTP